MIKLLSLTASPSPGPEPLTWARVREGVSWFFSNLSPAFVWPLFGLLIVAAFFAYYWWCLRPRPRSLEWIALAEEKSAPRRLTLTLKHHPMERGDALPLLLLTAVYALTAFFQLGDFNAPQSMVKFQQGDSHEFSYNQPVTVDTVSLYTSLGTGYYTLEWEGEDGQWHSLRLDQPYNSLFKWRVLDLERNIDQNGLEITKDNDNLEAEPLGPITAARFRITASSAPRDEGLWLSELALWSGGKALPQPDHVDEGTAALFDEHELWSDRYTYMNSTYFDEIYHPRTAYEHLNNVYPYEVSHPPLGKLIISIGIAMFGMVPFGWRFMGTLFGVLMVPILYVFLKNLFGKTPVALCGAALFTFDFMHLVQTRIATIDTYGVFFILVSYYFMYRWLAVPAGKKLRHYVLPLFLSGLFWGVGCASKWTVVYAGAGLALLWLLGMIFKAGDWHEAE
ncbi:MAG: glycosyltransferase family 39 protein, partial [Oscillospiraceae bacterium]|nr:glycosyltransferase family 39 protein [Oscillospiraceae bacterium]